MTKKQTLEELTTTLSGQALTRMVRGTLWNILIYEVIEQTLLWRKENPIEAPQPTEEARSHD